MAPALATCPRCSTGYPAALLDHRCPICDTPTPGTRETGGRGAAQQVIGRITGDSTALILLATGLNLLLLLAIWLASR